MVREAEKIPCEPRMTMSRVSTASEKELQGSFAGRGDGPGKGPGRGGKMGACHAREQEGDQRGESTGGDWEERLQGRQEQGRGVASGLFSR